MDTRPSSELTEEIAAAEAELKAAQEKLEAAKAKLAATQEAEADEPLQEESAELGDSTPADTNDAAGEKSATADEAAAAEATPAQSEPLPDWVPYSTASAPPSSEAAPQPRTGAPVPPAAVASQPPAPGQPQPPYNTAAYPSNQPSVQPGYAPEYGATQTPHAGPSAVPPQQPYYGYQPPTYQQPYPQTIVSSKDHVAAGLLAIFLGWLGVHKFYLGYNTSGFIMLAVSIIGGIFTISLAMWVIWIIAIIEGILYLTKSQTEFEQMYVMNKREWF